MAGMSEAKAVAAFARRMGPFIKSPPATGLAVVEAFVAFCRDVRVKGAEDAVMLEWGASRPLLGGFTDLRESDPEWDDVECQWVGLTRQVRSGREDDDTALSANLYFGKAKGDEPASNIEFEGLDDLDAHVERFLKQKYVAKLLGSKPSRVTAFASEVG